MYAAVLILLFLLHLRSLAHGHRASGGQVLLTHYMGFEDIVGLIVYSLINKSSALGILTDSVGPQRS
jgi:hypothetical protein